MKTQLITAVAALWSCRENRPDAIGPEPMVVCSDRRIGKLSVWSSTIIQHWLNGKKVIHFDNSDPKWAFNVELLKNRGAKLSDRGANLSLQDHGAPVWYRAIKLRALATDEKIDLSEVTPAKIADDVLEAERKKLEGIVNRRNPVKKK